MILFRTSTGDGEIHTYYELAIGADACGLTKSLITGATVPVLSIMTRFAFTRPLERFQSRARKSLPAASASIGI